MLGIEVDTKRWANELKAYEHNRKNLPYIIETPELITHKKMLEKDSIYNPITQKYNNKDYEQQVKSIEKQQAVDSVVKNYDHALKLEQYYNVINLQDKLKGLESHQSYPKAHTETIRKNLEVSKSNYNIVSNINLSQHHFEKPENRPQVEESKIGNRRYYKAAHSDYNNVYNRYLNNHDEKIRAERETQQLEAAVKFWQQNNYDPIRMKYIDEEKEKVYQGKLKEKEKVVRLKPDLDSFKG
jgi:hypothetical protein